MNRTGAVFTAATFIAVVCVGGVLIAIGQNPLTRLDTGVFDYTVAHRDMTAMHAVSVFSGFVSPVVVSAFTAIAAVVLVIVDRTLVRAATIVGAVAVGGALCEVLKLLVARPRPPYVGQLVHETGMSYPSGHVSGATSLLIALALTVFHGVAARRVAICFAVILAVVVAASRVYLQLHWTSDVVAALLVGTAAAVGVHQFFRHFQRQLAEEQGRRTPDVGLIHARRRSPRAVAARRRLRGVA